MPRPRSSSGRGRRDDLDLMIALLGDPAMTEHLGGPETPEALRKRLDRYLAMTPAEGRMFVISVGPRPPAGGLGGLLAARVGVAGDRLERAARVPGPRRRDARDRAVPGPRRRPRSPSCRDDPRLPVGRQRAVERALPDAGLRAASPRRRGSGSGAAGGGASAASCDLAVPALERDPLATDEAARRSRGARANRPTRWSNGSAEARRTPARCHPAPRPRTSRPFGHEVEGRRHVRDEARVPESTRTGRADRDRSGR